jgi:hypothetical protein
MTTLAPPTDYGLKNVEVGAVKHMGTFDSAVLPVYA